MLISGFYGENISEKIKLYSDAVCVNFPEQLSAFLVKYNGGETPKTSFFHENESSDIVAFYGLGDVKYSYSKVEPFSWQGKKYLPIAFDSFGNDIIIAVISGQIFFKDHETGVVIFLASDLREFVGICKSDKINLSSCKSIPEREQDLIQRGREHIITDALREMWQAEIDKYARLHQEEVTF